MASTDVSEIVEQLRHRIRLAGGKRLARGMRVADIARMPTVTSPAPCRRALEQQHRLCDVARRNRRNQSRVAASDDDDVPHNVLLLFQEKISDPRNVMARTSWPTNQEV